MRYTKVGDYYRVSRVTGPSHNLLGLSLSHEEPPRVVIQKLRGPESCNLIDEDRLEQAVVNGVNRANTSFGTNYHVVAIQYIPSDTPNMETYSFLARSLIENFAHRAEPVVNQA